MSTLTSYCQTAWSAWKRARAKTIPVEWLVACTATFRTMVSLTDDCMTRQAASDKQQDVRWSVSGTCLA